MRIDVAVTSWGGDCGPRPQSTSTTGGGTFRITQEGDHLTFQLPRQRTTQGCWSENRAVRRVSSSAQAGTWRIVCRTPPEDSRGETGTYTIQATSEDRISFRDVSAYDWQLNASRCQATITTTQSFTRVAQASTPPPEPPPEETRCTPGAAARVVLRPATAELTPGGQQCFTTRVLDRNGCALRSPTVALEVEGGAGRLEGRCYRASDDEESARITARVGTHTATASIRVRAVDLSDLIARRTETGSVGGVGANTEAASAETAARVSTEQGDEGLDLRWPALGLGLALILVLAGAIALVRRRKPRSTIAGLPEVDLTEPELARPDVPASDIASSEAAQPARVEAEPPSSGEDLICPTCRRGYPPGEVRCPHDDSALLPYREFTAAKANENVCPVCGERYPSQIKFCGKDGATLKNAAEDENGTQ